MSIYSQIYEFAASAGAFEGYVYHKREVDMNALPNWVNNLVTAYHLLPPEVRAELQTSVDSTVGRAMHSLLPLLGEGHEIIVQLTALLAGPLPDSADDFRKRKWFQE